MLARIIELNELNSAQASYFQKIAEDNFLAENMNQKAYDFLVTIAH